VKRVFLAFGALVLSLAMVAAIVLLFGAGNETAGAPASARVWLAHFAPFTHSLPATAVTVRVNGVDVLTGVQFGQTSDGYVTLPAGVPLLVEVVLPSGTVGISETFTLLPGTDYTVAAIGNIRNQPLEFFGMIDDSQPPPAGSGKVRLAHLAPIASSLPGTMVDIRTDDGIPVATNVRYKDYNDPFLVLPAGVYDLKITTPGGAVDLLDIDPIVLGDGVIVGAYAIGDDANQPLAVLPLVYASGRQHLLYLPVVWKQFSQP
jgi:hypothetical protein